MRGLRDSRGAREVAPLDLHFVGRVRTTSVHVVVGQSQRRILNRPLTHAVSVDGFARTQVALDFERSGARVSWSGGALEGARESAPVRTVAALLGGI